MARSVIALALAVLASCASERFVYAPATTTSAEIGNPPPGDIRLATLGVEKVDDLGGSGRAVEVRMLVTNRDRHAWTVDQSEQLIAIEDRGRKVDVNAIPWGARPRVVGIGPGKTVAIVLLFPLPSDVKDARDMPAFDAVAKVHAGERVVMVRSPFERQVVPPEPAETTSSPFDPFDTDANVPPAEPGPAPVPMPERWPPPHPID